MIILETERLLIKEIEQSDFECLYTICSNIELMKYVGDGIPLSKEITQKWLDITILNYATKGFGMYGVIYKSNNKFIGYCGLVYSKEINDNELIYALLKEYWGLGLATEMSLHMVQYGFNSLNLKNIFASIDPENIASEKILLKTGFKEVFKKEDEYGMTTTYFLIQPYVKDEFSA